MSERSMNFNFIFSQLPLTIPALLVGLTLGVPSAQAQDEDLDEEPPGETMTDEPEQIPELTLDPDRVKHGVGLRLRYIFVPKGLIEVFLEEAPSGVSQTGFGLEYVRREKEFEFSVGFEYDRLAPSNGFFVERGGSPSMPGTVDFIGFDGLSWYTIDAAFVFHHKLSKLVSLRYGGGFGFSYVSGDVVETDAFCNGNNTQEDCMRNELGGPGAQLNEKQDFFRYPPVLSVLGGVQITPADNVAINIELGMRTVFYFGLGTQYFF